MQSRSLALVTAPLLLLACSKPEPQKDPTPTPTASASAATSPTPAPSAAASASGATDPTASAAARASATASAAAPASATASATATATAGGGGAKVVTTTTTTTGPLNCGTKPLPDCPMQAWMKGNTALALSSNDMPALAIAFEKITKMAPAGYTNWVSISKDGAAAAKASNVDASKAACRSCHDQYKAKYKAEMRARTLP